MINLEDEARKRRERLKSSSVTNSSNSNNISKEKFIESKSDTIEISESESKSKIRRSGRKRKDQDQEEFKVPEGEILLDSSGAELLGIDSEIPDTLEAQAKSLLLPQNDLITNMDIEMINPKGRNSDLKREYERRIGALSKQTRRSVVNIVRDRLDKEAQDFKNNEIE